MQAGFEGIDLLQEREELVPHARRSLVPILSGDAESLRQGCRITQKPVAHDTVSLYLVLVSIISRTQRMARQQKSVGSGIIPTLLTP
jgi:hypothetical protein